MRELARRSATYEDLLAVPENFVAELIDGELHTNPRPAFRHARASGRLFRRLGNAFEDGNDGPGGWWLVVEPELHLGANVFVPDIAGWRIERVPVFPDVSACDIAPDWVCEVVSPATGRLDRTIKLPRYAKNGVVHAWIVDPNQKTLEVYRLDGEHPALISVHSGDDVVRAEPFDAIEIALATLWID